MRFSANLGFLYEGRDLPARVRAAARDGFDAVECHWPYDVPAAGLRAALAETGLPLLSLNTRPGDLSAGDFGLAALPGREAEARAALAEALDYAATAGARGVHVMAGRTGGGPAAEACYRAALAEAADRAAPRGLQVLIEPLNPRDAPGYHLASLDHALAIVADLDRPNLKVLFDAYHIQILHGDLTRRFAQALPHVGQVQIAGVPDRGEPDAGEVHYPNLLAAMRAAGWTGPVGAEYRPRRGRTEDGLGWLPAFRAALG